MGISVNPLAIVLDLAPQGALDQRLRHYQRSGDKLPAKSIQQIVLQIARALEYLHQQHIIYRSSRQCCVVTHFKNIRITTTGIAFAWQIVITKTKNLVSDQTIIMITEI